MKLILQICVLLGFTNIFIQCQSLRGANMIVLITLDTPYTMLRDDPQTNLTGNDRYEGYVVDLVDAISKMLNFNYVLKLSETGAYGSKDKTGQWNGMIGEVINGRTHVAAGAMTITSERENVVDFTLPFMHLGISVLYKHEVYDKAFYNNLEPLIYPFKDYPTDAFLLLSVILGIILLCLRRKYKTIGFRILLGFWLLFLFLFASLLIAQLSSFYARFPTETKIIASHFVSVEELASQRQILYGCIKVGLVKGGSTQAFFRNSESEIFSKMWSRMTETSAFVASNVEGIERVREGGYAFIAESPIIEYATSRQCNLYQVGGLLNSKGFGLAVQQGSPFREALSHAIIVLEEQGTLSSLKKKWWNKKNGGDIC